MAVDYTKATTVDVRDGVSSADYNRLALAFNDRLKNGVADPTWRLLWYAHSLVRGIRNPANFNYPAEDEWWKVYAHIKETSNITWPSAGAGEQGGVNVTNPLGAFIYGINPDIQDEEGRVNQGNGQFNPSGTDLADAPTGIPLLMGNPPVAPATNQDYWTLAKYQRGAVPSDLSSYEAANAIKASQEHGKINYPESHYFLKNYGGFLPSPPLDSTPVCDDGTVLDYDLKFTNLVGGSDKNYNTCPPNGVMFYFEGFSSYKIVKWNGSVISLPLTDYIEGPYEDNAFLRRYKGQQLNQALNWYAMEYRASETQRGAADMNRIKHGFQFQDFMTRQYALAPAYGNLDLSTYQLAAVYPEFDLSGAQVAGSYFEVQNTGTFNGGQYYTVPSKFTFAGYYAKAYGAGGGTVEIEVMDGNTVVDVFTLQASGDRLRYFPSAYNEAEIRFRLKSSLPSGLGVNIECAMLLAYRPTIYDAYVCLRLGSTNGPTSSGYDKSGYTFDSPKTISDNILDYGLIIRSVAGMPSASSINRNPVYESARRLIQNNLRMAERQSLVGYEVIGGKSYLHFKRFARGQYSGDLDVFDGIAPPDDNVASGDLIEGEQYQVWSTLGTGSITYNGTTYNPITNSGHSGGEQAGTFFTATKEKVYTASGDAVVRIRNGIRSSPIKDNRNDRFRGQTNEWLTQMTTTVYKLSGSSIFKPDAYGDVMGFLTDRCGLMSCAWSRYSGCYWTHRNELNAHFNYGSKMSLRPENPSGYRYALNSHGPSSGTQQTNSMVQSQNDSSTESGDINHFKSCQIYKPDLGVEAVYIDPSTHYSDADYNVIVKLDGRLDNENAPASISNNSSAWLSAFTGSNVQERRTDENAVLEYLHHIASYGSGSISDYNCIQRVGDIAYDANPGSGYSSNDFHGNCYPRFYFSKKIRHVWNDSNVSYNGADSLTTVDEMLYMEFVLQAISSGFIDKESTLQFSCTSDNRMFDYTFPNLCYQALKLSKTELTYLPVTRLGSQFTWEGEAGVNYTLIGVWTNGNEDWIADTVQSPYSQTGVPTYNTYRAYAASNNSTNRTVVDFTLTFSSNGDNVIAFSQDDAAHVRYHLLGRTYASGNSNDWQFYTSNPSARWSSNESDALSVSNPTTIASADARNEYRVEAVVYGRKRWFEFLPASLRPDNAQGFGPLPNTNLYARVFNNLANAVNLLTRARIMAPFNYEARDMESTYKGVATDADSTTYRSGIPDTNSYPFDYSCAEGTTKLADISLGRINFEATGGWSDSNPTVADRSLITAAGSWSLGSGAESHYEVSLRHATAPCGVGNSKDGLLMSSDTFTDGGIDYYKPFLISEKHKGEIRIKDDNLKYILPETFRDQFLSNPSFLGVEHHDLRTSKKDANGSFPQNNGQHTASKYTATTRDLYLCDIYEGTVQLDAKNSPLFSEFTSQSYDHYYEQKKVSTVTHRSQSTSSLSVTFQPHDDSPMFITIPLANNNYPTSTY